MSKDVEDILLQLYKVYFITIRHKTDFIMIKDPIPRHFYATTRRIKQNLFTSSETNISNSSEGESSSSSMSSIYDNSDAVLKPSKP